MESFIKRQIGKVRGAVLCTPRGRRARRIVKRCWHAVTHQFSVRLELSPREWWIVHWRTSRPREWLTGMSRPVEWTRLDLWVRLIPCAPIHLSFASPARLVGGTPGKIPMFVVAEPQPAEVPAIAAAE